MSVEVHISRPANRDATEVFVYRNSDKFVDLGGGYIGYEREVLTPEGNWEVVEPMAYAMPSLVVYGMALNQPYSDGSMDKLAMDLASRVNDLLNVGAA